MSFNPELISICTTNMNRNEYLLKALPTWLNRGFKEIVIVDWSSTVPLIEQLKEYSGENIKVVRVDNQVFFDCTKSRNLGARICTSKYLWLMDGDVKMTFSKSDFIKLTPGVFYHGTIFITGAPTTGSCILEKSMFDTVNGYSELIQTLPGEDLDLYKRLVKAGGKRKFFPFGSLKHIDHPYALRTKYRPWFGMSRAAGTRATFRLEEWGKRFVQSDVPHEIIQI